MNDGERLDDWWNGLIPSSVTDAENKAMEAQQGEATAALQSAQLTTEKLQDALSTIKVLTRERDEMEAIAERTHGDLLRVQVELDAAIKRAEAAEKERNALEWEADGFCGHCGEDAVRVSIDTSGYPHEVYAVLYCPVCHNAWVREEPVNPDAAQM